MKDGKFDERELRILESAARENGRSLVAAQASWDTLLGHLRAADFKLESGRIDKYGGLKLYGKLSGVQCIALIGGLASRSINITVFKPGPEPAVIATGELTAMGLEMKNHVLDWVLGREA